MESLILNIETSARCCSVCLSRNGEPWIVRENISDYAHAKNITLFIQEVLNSGSLTLNDISAVAVSRGPGSYTGLRIGVSTAKGLCFALDKPLLSVDTLKAISSGAKILDSVSDTAYVSLIDARRMDAYAAVYDADMQVVKTPFFCTLQADSFDFLLKDLNFDRVLVSGDAASKFRELVKNPDIFFSKIEMPSSKFMPALSQLKFEIEDFEDVAYFEPFYLKLPNITKAKPKF
jgi:tRNA threonylcarbamoyladenosine biosynthesis protein TsaB